MIYFICGTLAGIITGLGVGGGLMLIVLLNYLTGFTQLEIQSINLIYYIPTAIFSLFVYSKERHVDFKIGFKFIFVGALTAVLGAMIAHSINVELLKKLFAVYLITIGVYMLVKAERDKRTVKIYSS